MARLQDASGAAVTTMLKIMLDAKVPPGTRLRAAETVLNLAAKTGEVEDITERLAQLERAFGSVNPSRRPSALVTLPVRNTPGGALTHARNLGAGKPGTENGGQRRHTRGIGPTVAPAIAASHQGRPSGTGKKRVVGPPTFAN